MLSAVLPDGYERVVSQLRKHAWFFTLRALLYLLPGLSAAIGALVALLMTGRITPLLAGLTAVLIVLGFGVPPAVDWIRGRYGERVGREAQDTQRRREWADVAVVRLRHHFGPRGPRDLAVVGAQRLVFHGPGPGPDRAGRVARGHRRR